jgi:protein-tyrosine phosphatase
MCEMARADGVEHIVATPHANDKYRYDRKALAKLLEELSRRVGGSPKLSLGCDFHLSYENLVDALAHPAQYAIEGTKYLLVELSDFSVPPSVSDNLRRLLAAGMVPIVTHPERNPVLQRTPQRVVEWAEEGCLVQVTANSLTGRWGQQALKTEEWLMKREAVHVLASDAHGLDSRPPILSKARQAAVEMLGEAVANALVRENPAAIVAGEPLPGA